MQVAVNDAQLSLAALEAVRGIRGGMVKVLLFPLFPSHSVVPCAEEPLSVLSPGDVFLVATAASTYTLARSSAH